MKFLQICCKTFATQLHIIALKNFLSIEFAKMLQFFICTKIRTVLYYMLGGKNYEKCIQNQSQRINNFIS